MNKEVFMLFELGHDSFMGAILLSALYPICGIFLKIQSSLSNDAFDRPKIAILRKSLLFLLTDSLPAWNFLMISFSFYMLIAGSIFTDLSIVSTVEHTHSSLPILFKVSAVWGNHEGSMLLWTWVISLYHYIFSIRPKEKKSIHYVGILFIQGVVLLFFLTFTEFTSSPFLKIYLPFEDGAELNPVLQDLILAIHPPLIYLGYLGSLIPFSIAFFLFLAPTEQSTELFLIRRWALLTWVFLSIGILLGSWWAYYELGWGGWWFWDPVENCSLIPWILNTALIHSVLNTSRSNESMRIWTLILSFCSFFFSVLGTFFVRSGFLESVHSFANDSSRGVFLLIFSVIIFISMLYSFSRKNHVLFMGASPLAETRYYLLFFNMVLLLLMVSIILLGTFYPFIYKMIFKDTVTVGASFFNNLLGPLTAPMLFLMLFHFYFPWNSNLNQSALQFAFFRTSQISKFLIGGIIIVVVVSAAALYIYLTRHQDLYRYNVFYIVGISLFALLTTMIYGIIVSKKVTNLGMVLSHTGFFIFLIGVMYSSSYSSEITEIMHIGDTLHFHGVNYVLQSANQMNGPNYVSFYISLVGLDNNEPLFVCYPEKRYYYLQGIYSSKPYITTSFGYDIYTLLGDGNFIDGWEIKMYYNPLLSWIWSGGILVVFSSIFSLVQKNHK